MRRTSLRLKAGRIALVTVLLGCAICGGALSTTRTWDGGSNVNSNWTTPENWNRNTAPVAHDDLVFSTSTRRPSSNDFAAGPTFNTLTMGGSHQITGNGIALNAGISFATSASITLASIKLNNSQTFSVASGGLGSFLVS